MSDGWFALRAIDFSVEVTQAAGCRVGQFQQSLCVQGGKLQVVVQRAIFMVVCDQVQLGGGSCTIYICCYETCGSSIERLEQTKTEGYKCFSRTNNNVSNS